MAAPTYVTASTGSYDISGAWTHTSAAPGASGRILLVHLLQDGTSVGSNQPTISSVTNAEDLAGTDNVLTYIGSYEVGAPVAAYQHLWIGRSLSTSAMVITGANAGGDDIYVRVYEISNVNTGTTLAEVIENAMAGITGSVGLGTGAGPYSVCVDSGRTYAYSTNNSGNTVSKIRLSDMTVTGTASLGSSHSPRDICIDSAGAYVYVANYSAATMEQVRVSDMTVTGTTTGFSGPTGICIDSSDVYVYVADNAADTVKQVRLSDMTVTGTASLGASHGPFGVCISGGYLYVANETANTVEQITISSMTVTGTCSLGASHSPEGICVDATGAYVYVANNVGQTVEQVRTSDMTVTGTASLGASQYPVGVAIGGDYVYVGNSSGNSVMQVRISDMTVTGTFSLGTSHSPYFVRVDSSAHCIYAACNGSNSVERIDITPGAGNYAGGADTSGTVADVGVTTLGPDRLALQLTGISDDNAQSAFTGETGGDWTEAVAEYAESSGTDASIGLQTATMTTAGTIDGGTFANADSADGWGVVGFALIGTTKTSLLRPHRYHLIRR